MRDFVQWNDVSDWLGAYPDWSQVNSHKSKQYQNQDMKNVSNQGEMYLIWGQTICLIWAQNVLNNML